MAVKDQIARETGDGAAIYKVAGSLTILRAATTSREIDALPDPLTIDLSEVTRMDTVGAWIIHRTVRDRSAKVVGASPKETSLLEQVAEADRPVRSIPMLGRDDRVLDELGNWIYELARPLSGCSASLARH